VIVDVIVDVIGNVIARVVVVALVIGNDTVDMADTVDISDRSASSRRPVGSSELARPAAGQREPTRPGHASGRAGRRPRFTRADRVLERILARLIKLNDR
jgi:hypothetical protein